jgi:hypothetical protein
MLAEAFDEEVRKFCQSTEFEPELQFKLDLVGLYEMFLNRKYDICVEEKFKIPVTIEGADSAAKLLVETVAGKHQILALEMLFGEKQVAFLHNNSQCTSSDEELTKTGIVQIGHDGKLQFIHRTFGEFYAAGYFVRELTKRSDFSKQIQDLLLHKVFQVEEYRVIRVFIDGLLSRSKPSNVAKKQYGERLHGLGEHGELTLHTASSEGNVNIIAILLDSLVETGHKNTLGQLLLAQDHNKQTAWHVASENGQLEVLIKLWELAEEELTPDEINYP